MKPVHYPFAHQSIFMSGRRVRLASQKQYVISSTIVTQQSLKSQHHFLFITLFIIIIF